MSSKCLDLCVWANTRPAHPPMPMPRPPLKRTVRGCTPGHLPPRRPSRPMPSGSPSRTQHVGVGAADAHTHARGHGPSYPVHLGPGPWI